MTIELLEASSIMIGVFEDPKPVDSIDDSRLHQLDVALAWFTKWEESVMSIWPVHQELKAKCFCQISYGLIYRQWF